MRRAEWWPAAAAALALAAVAYVAARGVLPEPGGFAGHACGVAGYLLMLVAAFGYSWRKSPTRRARGSARTWMRVHVTAGLAGPALVLLHGGLAVRGLAGVTTLLLLVVVASGAVGRWLHPALPRGVGDAGDGERARRVAEELERLEQEAAMRETASPDDEGGAVAVATRAASAAAVAAQRRTLHRLRAEDERRAARERAGARLRGAAGAWWVLHVPVAMAMLLLGLAHALAALWYRTPTR